MKDQPNRFEAGRLQGLLWAGVGLFAVLLVVVRIFFEDRLWLTIVVGLLLAIQALFLIVLNQKELRSRSVSYSSHSFLTSVLVLGLIGLVNFLASRHPLEYDTTQNKLHTFSDQTRKVMKELKKKIRAVYFANQQQREQQRVLFDHYQRLAPSSFQFEWVNPDVDPMRAKQSGIKAFGTLVLSLEEGKEVKVDSVNEEKVTNAIIQLLKEKRQRLCVVTGHGEKSFEVREAEGLAELKKSLLDQSFELTDLSLIENSKNLETCDAWMLWGPSRALFPEEVKHLQENLQKGGRGLIGLEFNLKGENLLQPELLPLLKDWYVQPTHALIVDPLSRLFQADASVAIVASYSSTHPVTKDFQGNSFFPFSMPLQILSGVPEGWKVESLGQTTPKSWAIKHLKKLNQGASIQFVEGVDQKGPLSVAVGVQAKKSGAVRETRLVVFSSALFPANVFARFGTNIDFFMNAASWVLEDESFISIRSKEAVQGKVELSQNVMTFIFWVVVIFLPLSIAVFGIVVWMRRKRL